MTKIGFSSILIVATLFAIAVRVEAQSQGKVPKIGWLSARRASNSGQETIVRMLRDLGYIEGKNVAFEYRFADDKLDRLPPPWPMSWSALKLTFSSRLGPLAP